MKVRTGFVSNSSSSSFILKSANDIAMVANHNVKVYKVSELIDRFKPMKEAMERLNKMATDYDWSSEEYPYFLVEEFHYMDNFSEYESLVELEKRCPGCYITGAYDRDVAYRNNFHFEVFKGDM